MILMIIQKWAGLQDHMMATPPVQMTYQSQISVVYCRRSQGGVVSRPVVRLHVWGQKVKLVMTLDMM